MTRQKTIQTPITVEGAGIHTGALSIVRLFPAEINSGIVFHFPNHVAVRLVPESVIGKSRGTSLVWAEGELKTIEHLLAALSGCGITNLRIEATGEELPILDGSARPWCEQLMKHAGISEQTADTSPLTLSAPVRIQNESSWIHALPSDRLHIVCETDYPVLGKQKVEYTSDTDFVRDIAPARTFGFASELGALKAGGLAKGASLENAILIGEDGTFSTPLRFPDEPARHKLLDLLGDLAALGHPLHAEIHAHKPGHVINVEWVRAFNALNHERHEKDEAIAF